MVVFSFSPVVIVTAVFVVFIAVAMSRIGARRGLENLGRNILRAASGGDPKVADEASKHKAMAVGGAILIALFVIFLILALRGD